MAGNILSKKPIENYSSNTYCRTDPELETYEYEWTINKFMDVYNFASVLKFGPMITFPFQIIMTSDKENNKIIFYIKNPLREKFSSKVFLRSISKEHSYQLTSYSNEEKVYHELDICFLKQEGQKFMLYGTLIFHFVIHYVQRITHNIMHTNQVCDVNVTNVQQLQFTNSVTLVTFKVQGKNFYVNKDLLCAKSEYFKFLYNSYPLESAKEYVIDNMDPDIVEIFLAYIQTGNTYNLKNLNFKTLCSLFFIAQIFIVKDYQIICEQFLKCCISIENCLEILKFAYDNSVQNLLEFTINYIVLNINEIIKSPVFLYTSVERPELISLLKKNNLIIQRAIYKSHVPVYETAYYTAYDLKNENKQFFITNELQPKF